MFGVECFDTHDEPISHYTQWDINQTLKIVLCGMDAGYMKNAPYVHFANIKSSEALVVPSTLQGDNTIIVDIPNILLQAPWPLLVYVYLSDSTDASSQRTIVKIEIPVHKRARPSDYEYVENIDRVTAEAIKQEIYDDLMDEVHGGELKYPQVTFVDGKTGKSVNLKVSGGKIGLYVDSTNRQLLDTGDIVNNLMTNDSSKVLSASMGTTLKNMIDVIPDQIDEKIEEHDSSPTSHSDIRDDISSVSSTVDTMQNSIAEIEKKIDDAMLDDTISGSGVLTTTDALVDSSPIEMRIKGNTRQNLWVNPATRTINGVTLTVNDDGSFSVSGTSSAAVSARIKSGTFYTLKPNTNYILSIGAESESIRFFGLTAYKEDGTSIDFVFGGSQIGGLTKTFTTPSDLTHCECCLGIPTAGITVSGTYRVMLNEGSTAQPWCPPGLNSVDELSVVCVGKNLYKPFTAGKVTANDDGSMTVGASAVIWSSGSLIPINLPAGTQVTLSTDNVYGGSVGFGAFFFASDNSRTEANLFNLSSRTIQLSEDCVAYQCWFNGPTDSALTSHVMMEIGSTATSFEPYQGTTTPIDLDGHTLNSLPDGTRDELRIDGTGAVTLTKRVGVKELPGDAASWTQDAGGSDVRYMTGISPDAVHNYVPGTVMSDALPPRGATDDNYGSTCIIAARDNAYASIGSGESAQTIASVCGGKTLLYPLATPQTIKLSSITLSPFPSDKSNIYTTSNIPTAGLTVRYWKKSGDLVANLYKLLLNAQRETS